jgi:hypothetical protein
MPVLFGEGRCDEAAPYVTATTPGTSPREGARLPGGSAANPVRITPRRIRGRADG